MKWFENKTEVIEFAKFLVDTDIVSNQQKLSHYFNNPENCDKAHNLYEKKIKNLI